MGDLIIHEPKETDTYKIVSVIEKHGYVASDRYGHKHAFSKYTSKESYIKILKKVKNDSPKPSWFRSLLYQHGWHRKDRKFETIGLVEISSVSDNIYIEYYGFENYNIIKTIATDIADVTDKKVHLYIGDEKPR